MRFFNVLCHYKRAPGAQYLCGNDEAIAKRTAAEASAKLKRGDEVTLWSIDTQTGLKSEIACVG